MKPMGSKINGNGFSIIVAHDEERGIGKNNKIPWYIKEDLQHFKAITLHGVVIMGHKTWESLPKSVRPLPFRENVIISKSLKRTNQITENLETHSELAGEVLDGENPFKCLDLSQESVHLESSLEEAIENGPHNQTSGCL